jgi:glycogen debranching enzyme
MDSSANTVTANPVDVEVRRAALDVLLHNRRQGVDPRYHRTYNFTCPSPTKYKWQWFWDSCFHAIALSHLDPRQAREELLSLVSAQEPDGFMGHIIFWGGKPFLEIWAYLESKPSLRPRHSGIIQPPVLAYALQRVFQATNDMPFLKEMLPHVDRYHQWLDAHRDPDGDGLISIISPYESGVDHKPSYDTALGISNKTPMHRASLEFALRRLDFWNMRHGFNGHHMKQPQPFSVEDVLVNCIYAQGMYSLSQLHKVVGDTARCEAWDKLARRTEQAILTKCLDPQTGLYFDLSGRNEAPLRTSTVTSLFPLILPHIPKESAERLVKEHLMNPDEFWLRYPVPSVSAREPSFHPSSDHYLWRGPTWMSTNWYLTKALRLHGYGSIADVIAKASKDLVMHQGFREYYNPITGKGMGAKNFTWGTLVVDMFEGDRPL